MTKFETNNDLRLTIKAEEKEILVDEVCCTTVNIILKNDGQIMTSFLGAHNPEIIKNLERTLKLYFKGIKKALKGKMVEEACDEQNCCCETSKDCDCGNDCHCHEDKIDKNCHCHEKDNKDNCHCGEGDKTKDCGCHNKNEKHDCHCGEENKKTENKKANKKTNSNKTAKKENSKQVKSQK